MPTKILIVDDHELLRQGLKALLQPEPDLDVVGDAGTGAEALTAVHRLMPDVLLLDMGLPDLHGVEVCRLVTERYPSVAVIALSGYEDDDLVIRCIRAGVRGYLVKSIELSELRRSIHAVARGEVAIDPKVGAHVIERLRSLPEDPAAEPPLSDQQRAILRLLSNGYRTREIATRLSLTENTVKGYVQGILQRLGVHNRTEAVILASRRGWL